MLAITSMGVSFHVAKKMMAGEGGAENPLNFTIGFKAIAAVFFMVLPLAVLFAAGIDWRSP